MTAEELWADFCQQRNIDKNTEYEAWAFCGGGPEGDELTRLVLNGIKFGTASAYDFYAYEDELDELPNIGDYSVLLWDNEEAACVIRNYDVYIRPFSQVPPFHCYAEGERDRSLNDWREIHKEAFEQDLLAQGTPLTDKSLIVCEKFSVEYIPGAEASSEDELFFVEPSMNYASEITSYREEMLAANSSFDGCFSMKRMPDPQEYVDYCINWSNPDRPADSHGVWGNVIFCIRKSDGRMVGCMQVHNVLNERMKNYTGHVGYSVRPSERRKGYATRMLSKAKDFLSTFGIDEMMISCLPENEASRKTILANGGKFVEKVFLEEDNVWLEKYVIALKENNC